MRVIIHREERDHQTLLAIVIVWRISMASSCREKEDLRSPWILFLLNYDFFLGALL